MKEKAGVVICPKCNEENEFDIENDAIVCMVCDCILNIHEKDGKFVATVV